VGEHIAVERAEGGIVDVGREHAFLEVVEDDYADGAPQAPKRFFVEFRPAPRARLEREQPDALAAVALGEDEQARAPVLPGGRVPDHRPVAVVDLAFLARRGDDHRMGLGRPLAAQPPDEAPHAGVAGQEAVVIDEVLPDRHGVAAAAEGQLDQLAIRLARTGRRGPAGRRWPRREVDELRRDWPDVGGHLTGRICPGRWTPDWPDLPGRWTPHWPVLAAAGAGGARGSRSQRP
jgi:hypothetical protein